MKREIKINILFLLGLILTFNLSCNKDESFKGTTDAAVVGVWDISTSNGEVTINGKSMVDYLMDTFQVTEEVAQQMQNELADEYGMTGTIEFFVDKSYELISDGDTLTGTWTLSDDGKQMLLDSGTEDERIVKIKSANSSRMVVEISDEVAVTDELMMLGIFESVSVTTELTLTK